MIEQTELLISKWHYTPPVNPAEDANRFSSFISFDVMKKRASTKKGIACRFSCRFVDGDDTILEYVAADSYVIDFEYVIDKQELQTMVRNSYSKFTDRFNLKKLTTVLNNRSLLPLDETDIDWNSILILLV